MSYILIVVVRIVSSSVLAQLWFPCVLEGHFATQ